MTHRYSRMLIDPRNGRAEIWIALASATAVCRNAASRTSAYSVSIDWRRAVTIAPKVGRSSCRR